MMDSVPVPKIQATHLSTEENGCTARARGRIWEPPLWKAHSCLSEGPQRQAGRGVATGDDTLVPVTVRKSRLISQFAGQVPRRSTSKLEEWGVKVFGICLFPYLYLKTGIF